MYFQHKHYHIITHMMCFMTAGNNRKVTLRSCCAFKVNDEPIESVKFSHGCKTVTKTEWQHDFGAVRYE